MSGFKQHLSSLDAAWKLVHQRWEVSGELWNDRVHDEFAVQHMAPLAQQTQATQAALERLAQMVAKAERVVK